MPELLGVTSLVLGFVVVLVLALRHKPVQNVLVCAFSLRAVTACIHYWIFPLPYGTKDAVGFERTAWQWGKEGFLYALSQFNPAASYVYSWMCSLLYAVTGRSALMLQGINVLGGTLIVFHMYLISKELWGKRRAKTMAWFIAFFPFLVQIAAVTHREVVIVYFLTLGVLFLVRWGKASKILHLLLGLGALLVATTLHGGMAAAMLGAGMFVFGSSLRRTLKRLLIGRIRIPAFITVVFLIIVALGGGAAIGQSFRLSSIGNITNIDVEVFASMAQSRARGEAAYLEGMYPRSFIDVTWQTPLRILYFLFTPLPWHIEKVSHVVALIDMLFYAVVLWGIWRSRNYIWNNRGALVALFLLAVSISAFAVVTSNFGTAMRHRAKFVPILAALWAVPVVQSRFVLFKT